MLARNTMTCFYSKNSTFSFLRTVAYMFRNGLMPKKLHLEIALGDIYSKEGL